MSKTMRTQRRRRVTSHRRQLNAALRFEAEDLEATAQHLCKAIMDVSSETFWLDCPDPMEARRLMLRRVERYRLHWLELQGISPAV